MTGATIAVGSPRPGVGSLRPQKRPRDFRYERLFGEKPKLVEIAEDHVELPIPGQPLSTHPDYWPPARSWT